VRRRDGAAIMTFVQRSMTLDALQQNAYLSNQKASLRTRASASTDMKPGETAMTTAKETTKTIEAAVEATATKATAATADVQKKVAANVEAMTAETQKVVAENVEKAAKSLETVTAFGQETLDALLKSQNVAAKAAEEIQAEVIAFSKKTVEEGVAHAKDLATAQTVTAFIEKQAGFAKVTLDALVQQSTRMSELMVAASKEVFAPLNARAAAAAELMKVKNA